MASLRIGCASHHCDPDVPEYKRPCSYTWFHTTVYINGNTLKLNYDYYYYYQLNKQD